MAQVLQKIEAEYAKNQKRYNLAAVENMDEITRLLDEYHPKAGSEAEFLISQILISARIYRNNRDANAGKLTGLASNYEREENMKTLFMLEYRKAQAAGDPLPKVILKTGHNHAIRGRSTSNVLALGNFLSEFAKSNGLESFHLATYRNNAAGDFGVLANIPDLKPFADAAPKDKWIVIDVRPLREYVHAGKLTAITTPEFRRVVMGFDAVLLIGNAKPATFRSTQEQ